MNDSTVSGRVYAKDNRVGLYIKPETRKRLNLFKASLGYASGEFVGHDEAINALLDRYIATEPKDNRVIELA